MDFPLFISWLDICCGELTTMIGDDRRRSELGYFYTWRSQGLLTFISPSFCDVANTCVYYIYIINIGINTYVHRMQWVI